MGQDVLLIGGPGPLWSVPQGTVLVHAEGQQWLLILDHPSALKWLITCLVWMSGHFIFVGIGLRH